MAIFFLQGKPPDWQDFVGIITLLLINSTISFIEENNAGNAAAALMARLAPKAKVSDLRNFISFYIVCLCTNLNENPTPGKKKANMIEGLSNFNKLKLTDCNEEYICFLFLETLNFQFFSSLFIVLKVLRDGRWSEQDAAVLVPGDIVSIKLGDIVPADARLLEGDPLKIDQVSEPLSCI